MVTVACFLVIQNYIGTGWAVAFLIPRIVWWGIVLLASLDK